MADVIQFKGSGIAGDGLVVDPNAVLEGAKGKLRNVMVCGWGEDGELYVASSHGAAEAVFLIETAKLSLLPGCGMAPGQPT